MRAALFLLASGVVGLGAGCGRLDFAAVPVDSAPAGDDARMLDGMMIDGVMIDAAPDADSAGHDEDADGIPDVDDPCPADVAVTPDTDLDGIGDLCDPNPGTAGDTVVGFWTLRPGDNPFDDISGFTQDVDSLHTSNVQVVTNIPRPVRTIRVEIGFVIHGLVGTDQHQVASGLYSLDPIYYFTELNDNAGTTDAGIYSYDTTNGYQPLDARTHTGIHPGAGLLRYDANATTQMWQLATGWTNELYFASAATPSYTGGDGINVVLNGLDIDLTYVWLVASP